MLLIPKYCHTFIYKISSDRSMDTGFTHVIGICVEKVLA